MIAAQAAVQWVTFGVVALGLVIAHLPLKWIPGSRPRRKP